MPVSYVVEYETPVWYKSLRGRGSFATVNGNEALRHHYQIERFEWAISSVSGAETFLCGIHKLMPGHTLEVDENGALRIDPYWDLTAVLNMPFGLKVTTWELSRAAARGGQHPSHERRSTGSISERRRGLQRRCSPDAIRLRRSLLVTARTPTANSPCAGSGTAFEVSIARSCSLAKSSSTHSQADLA